MCVCALGGLFALQCGMLTPELSNGVVQLVASLRVQRLELAKRGLATTSCQFSNYSLDGCTHLK